MAADLPPTARELEVFAAYCQAGTIRAAATTLGLSEQTAKNHVSALYRSLGVSHNLGAAIALGWLVVPPSFAPLAVPRLVEAHVLARLGEIHTVIGELLDDGRG